MNHQEIKDKVSFIRSICDVLIHDCEIQMSRRGYEDNTLINIGIAAIKRNVNELTPVPFVEK